jgi:WD40 repeat protein
VIRIAWFPDGQRLALGQHPGRVGIWSLKTAGMKIAFAGHDKLVYAVAVMPDSSAVLSAAADGAVMVWTVPGNE